VTEPDDGTTRDVPTGDEEAVAAEAVDAEATRAEIRRSRSHSLARLALVLAYLFVVFGILLPNVIDYGEVVAALQAAPPQALAVVALIGFGCWILEGLAIKALMPGLSVVRSVTAYLSMAAVGNTIPGPVSLAVGYALFRSWQIPPGISALGISLNSLLAQVGKLLLPAIAILFLTLAGTIPTWGYFAAALIATPVVIGSLIAVWVLRSEAFARRVGAMAERATDAVMHRIRRPEPEDLTGRLLDFRDSAHDLLRRRAVPTVVTQVLVRAGWGVCLFASLRAVGIGPEILPADVILAVYAAVVAITVIPIAPGGAGLPELLYIAFFTRYVADPQYDDAIAAGVMLFRVFQWFALIPVGYVVLLIARRAARRAAPVTDPTGAAGSSKVTS
jgi:putative heme transporter